jgi:hypothetical protein
MKKVFLAAGVVVLVLAAVSLEGTWAGQNKKRLSR